MSTRFALGWATLASLAACGPPAATVRVPTQSIPETTQKPAAARTAPATPRGPRHFQGKTVRLRIDGTQEVPSAELAAALLVDKEDLPPTPPPTDRDGLITLVENDALLLAALYYDRGYVNAEFDTPTMADSADGRFIDVVLHVKAEGARHRLGRYRAAEANDKKLYLPPPPPAGIDLAHLSLTEGAWFSRKPIVEDVLALQRAYRNLGYAKVEVEPQTTLRENVIDVDIVIRRGPLVRLERIATAGNRKTPSERIVQAFGWSVGDLFSEAKVEDGLRRVQKLRGVEKATISTETGKDESQLVIVVEVVEK